MLCFVDTDRNRNRFHMKNLQKQNKKKGCSSVMTMVMMTVVGWVSEGCSVAF